MIGRIYKVYNITNENIVYIGSTSQNLENRLAQHISSFKSYINGGSYYSVFDLFLNNNNMMFDNIKIELIREVEIDSEIQLKIYEHNEIIEFKLKGYTIVNINKPINKNTYVKNKLYREYYKKGRKCKITIKCPCCDRNLKISISPTHHFDEDCFHFSDEE